MNGLSVDFAFGPFNEHSGDILPLAALGLVEQLRNIGFQGLRSMNGSRFGANWSPAEHAGLFKYLADEVSSDGMSASGQERFADDVAELSHIARPGVLLEAF